MMKNEPLDDNIEDYISLTPPNPELSEDAAAYLESLRPELRCKLAKGVSVLLHYGFAARKFQLEAAANVLSGQDTLLNSATGSGKTLVMALIMHSAPGTCALGVLPLKDLMKSQVEAMKRYGIEAVAINDDTPSDVQLWKDIENGAYTYYLVGPEQLQPSQGSLSRFGKLMQQIKFRRRFRFKIIDECHYIEDWGTCKGLRTAFRPAFSSLGKTRERLPCLVATLCLSATMPAHTRQVICRSLQLKEENITLMRLPLNRPNLTYAVDPLNSSSAPWKDLWFLVPLDYRPSLANLPKTIIFMGDKRHTDITADFLNARFCAEMRNLGIAKHYHASMSEPYLTATYNDFVDPNSNCRILVATSKVAAGVDVMVTNVIKIGVTENLNMLRQMEGRCARNPLANGIVLLLAEKWAYGQPPVQPNNITELRRENQQRKQDRTDHSVYEYVQHGDCRRAEIKRTNEDESDIALNYTGRYCCDNHDDFRLDFFFPCMPDPLPPTPQAPPPIRNVYRKPEQRGPLADHLKSWLHRRLVSSRFKAMFIPQFILDESEVKLLVWKAPGTIASAEEITTMLKRTGEWARMYADDIYTVIESFDNELHVYNSSNPAKRLRISM